MCCWQKKTQGEWASSAYLHRFIFFSSGVCYQYEPRICKTSRFVRFCGFVHLWLFEPIKKQIKNKSHACPSHVLLGPLERHLDTVALLTPGIDTCLWWSNRKWTVCLCQFTPPCTSPVATDDRISHLFLLQKQICTLFSFAKTKCIVVFACCYRFSCQLTHFSMRLLVHEQVHTSIYWGHQLSRWSGTLCWKNERHT